MKKDRKIGAKAKSKGSESGGQTNKKKKEKKKPRVHTALGGTVGKTKTTIFGPCKQKRKRALKKCDQCNNSLKRKNRETGR